MSDNSDVLKSEIVLGIDGSYDQEVGELMDLLFYECLTGKGEPRRKAFEIALALASHRDDLRNGEIKAGSWCTKDDGWVYIYRNEAGYSLWYHPQEDAAILQRNFF